MFSAYIYHEKERIARISREWCVRLMQSGGPGIAHAVVRGLWGQDPIDLRSVQDILLVAAESNDEDTIRDVVHVLGKGVGESPNEAAEVLSTLWSRQISRQIVLRLSVAEMQHEVLEELLQNDDCTVANRQLAWDIFDEFLKAGDTWAVRKFDEYVGEATVG